MTKTDRRGRFRNAVISGAAKDRSKASNFGHLHLPKGVNVFKEEPGSLVTLDILPYFVTDEHHPDRDDEFDRAVVGELWYRRPYKIHGRIGPNNVSIVCPTSIGKKCPICEYRTKQLNEGAKWDDKAISAMRPQERILYYVCPKGNRKFEDRPHLWDIAFGNYQKLLNEMLEMDEEFGDFAEPDGGYTLKIRFSAEKFNNNEYAKASVITFVEREYMYTDDVIKSLASLDDVLDIKDYREVERLFFDSGDGEEDDDNDAGAESDAKEPTPQQRTPITRTRTVSTNTATVTELKRPTQTATTVVRQPRKQEPETEPDEQEKERTSQPSTVTRQRLAATSTVVSTKPTRDKTPVAASDECPSGYEFGTDCDTKNECEDCPVWNECYEAKEAAA